MDPGYVTRLLELDVDEDDDEELDILPDFVFMKVCQVTFTAGCCVPDSVCLLTLPPLGVDSKKVLNFPMVGILNLTIMKIHKVNCNIINLTLRGE